VEQGDPLQAEQIRQRVLVDQWRLDAGLGFHGRLGSRDRRSLADPLFAILGRRGSVAERAEPGPASLATVAEDARAELTRLWEEHLAAPSPMSGVSLRSASAGRASGLKYGTSQMLTDSPKRGAIPTCPLYDTYVAGHVSTVLTGRQSGADVLGVASRDERLARYFEVCVEEAPMKRCAERSRRAAPTSIISTTCSTSRDECEGAELATNHASPPMPALPASAAAALR
jgi:hypothetical protein